jgi:hypothetical protein
LNILQQRWPSVLDIAGRKAALGNGRLFFERWKILFLLMAVGVGSAKLRMKVLTGLVIRTGLKAGKVKNSQVLFIEKGSELGPASGVTSRLVLPDGSSKGLRSMCRSWRGHRAIAKEVKERGERAG